MMWGLGVHSEANCLFNRARTLSEYRGQFELSMSCFARGMSVRVHGEFSVMWIVDDSRGLFPPKISG